MSQLGLPGTEDTGEVVQELLQWQPVLPSGRNVLRRQRLLWRQL